MELVDNKVYASCKFPENINIFEGCYQDYGISVEILERLSKSLGFSYNLYCNLLQVDTYAANAVVNSVITQNNIEGITLLLDEENHTVIDYSFEFNRIPILNKEFINRVLSLSDTSEEIEISELYYHKDDTLSSVILKKRSPILIENKWLDRDSTFTEYPVGILLVNDEINSVYSRLVVYIEGEPFYLPASYYNATTSRYKRSTSSSVEALEVLVLKVIDDLRDEELQSRMKEFHYRYSFNKQIFASYEEYNAVLRTMRKIPTIIEDNSFLESLLSKYENFERKYSHLEDKKSSYVWRCTALSDITVGALVSITANILSEVNAPPIEYYTIRDLLGSYISTNRIAEEIAKEDLL